MKLQKSVLALLLSTALVFSFASCSNDDEGSSPSVKNEASEAETKDQETGSNESGSNTTGTTDTDGTTNTTGTTDTDGTTDTTNQGTTDNNSGTTDTTDDSLPSVELPASVGNNPFAGKTFVLDDSHYDSSMTLTFTEDVMTRTYKTQISYYKYSYNATTKMLYWVPVFPVKDGDKTITSINEHINYVKTQAEAKGKSWTKNKEICTKAQIIFALTHPEAYLYTFTDTGLSLENYFTGDIAQNIRFYWHEEYSSPSYAGRQITTEFAPGFAIIAYLNSEDISYNVVLTHKDNGTFTGNVYNEKEDTLLGTLAGTYSISGTGTSGCTLTYNFTSLPNEILELGFATNTNYVLEHRSYGPEVYTLAR